MVDWQYMCSSYLPTSSFINIVGVVTISSQYPVVNGLKSKPVYSSSSAYHDCKADLCSPCFRSNVLSN